MKKTLILTIILLCCLSCNSSTEPYLYEQVYVVESIGNVLLKEWTEEMKNGMTDFPLEIKIKIVNGKYSGTVKLFKLGILPIQNYDNNYDNKNRFYINTEGKLPHQIQSIAFSKIEIKSNKLTGYFVFISPIIDMSVISFTASMK